MQNISKIGLMCITISTVQVNNRATEHDVFVWWIMLLFTSSWYTCIHVHPITVEETTTGCSMEKKQSVESVWPAGHSVAWKPWVLAVLQIKHNAICNAILLWQWFLSKAIKHQWRKKNCPGMCLGIKLQCGYRGSNEAAALQRCSSSYAFYLDMA